MKIHSLGDINSRVILRHSAGPAAIACLGLTVLLTGCGSKADSAAAASGSAASVSSVSGSVVGQDTVDDNGIDLPYAIDEGKLTINSVFTSDIENPDAENQAGDGIVSVEVENTSDSYLTQAALTVTLDDGRAVPISIRDLPAGEKIWAFAADNSAAPSGEAEVTAEEVSLAESEYTDAPSQIQGLDISVEGTVITLVNNTGDDLTNLNVFCHTRFDEVLFGGISYTYTVDSLSAGETTTVDAADCWLGEAEVIGAYVQ